MKYLYLSTKFMFMGSVKVAVSVQIFVCSIQLMIAMISQIKIIHTDRNPVCRHDETGSGVIVLGGID